MGQHEENLFRERGFQRIGALCRSPGSVKEGGHEQKKELKAEDR
jgi:hypothetical protein